jgi:hypothetical protein
MSPSSELTSEPNKKPTWQQANVFFLGLYFGIEDGGDMFF